MARPQKSILSEWEQKLMNIIWELNSASANDVVDQLKKHNIDRSNSAVRTILTALVKKGYLTQTLEEKAYIYHPAFTKEEVEDQVLEYIRQVFFNGSVKSMMARLIDDEIYDEEEK